ncbi:MAG: hypothetical protein LBM96_00665 [Methanobrevibacter sp.]|jgi:hypothetical protein|nr:hypothetical protein [Candidatus Methanoflexus mossambicus]
MVTHIYEWENEPRSIESILPLTFLDTADNRDTHTNNFILNNNFTLANWSTIESYPNNTDGSSPYSWLRGFQLTDTLSNKVWIRSNRSDCYYWIINCIDSHEKVFMNTTKLIPALRYGYWDFNKRFPDSNIPDSQVNIGANILDEYSIGLPFFSRRIDNNADYNGQGDSKGIKTLLKKPIVGGFGAVKYTDEVSRFTLAMNKPDQGRGYGIFMMPIMYDGNSFVGSEKLTFYSENRSNKGYKPYRVYKGSNAIVEPIYSSDYDTLDYTTNNFINVDINANNWYMFSLVTNEIGRVGEKRSMSVFNLVDGYVYHTRGVKYTFHNTPIDLTLYDLNNNGFTVNSFKYDGEAFNTNLACFEIAIPTQITTDNDNGLLDNVDTINFNCTYTNTDSNINISFCIYHKGQTTPIHADRVSPNGIVKIPKEDLISEDNDLVLQLTVEDNIGSVANETVRVYFSYDTVAPPSPPPIITPSIPAGRDVYLDNTNICDVLEATVYDINQEFKYDNTIYTGLDSNELLVNNIASNKLDLYFEVKRLTYNQILDNVNSVLDEFKKSSKITLKIGDMSPNWYKVVLNNISIDKHDEYSIIQLNFTKLLPVSYTPTLLTNISGNSINLNSNQFLEADLVFMVNDSSTGFNLIYSYDDITKTITLNTPVSEGTITIDTHNKVVYNNDTIIENKYFNKNFDWIYLKDSIIINTVTGTLLEVNVW